MGAEFVQLSLTPLAIAVMAAITCALPGNFLILRRQALIGDAISHVVLPGIVVGFIVSGTITTWPMMLGAGAASLFAVIMIETIKRLGKIESGAAMGVTFTAMFAAGVLLLEQTNTASVHLDVEHALFGNLESLIWFEATGWGSLLDAAALADLPPEFTRMAAVGALVVVLITLFWRPLVMSTFDEAFAASVGVPVATLSLALVIMAAVAAVAAFDAVGSIIVIAMFICPPATARLMTDRMAIQVLISAVVAALSAIVGYVAAGYGPLWLGFDNAVSAAGMIATVSGMALAVAVAVGPRRRRVGGPQSA